LLGMRRPAPDAMRWAGGKQKKLVKQGEKTFL
jgi:hypothetical protein